MPELHASIGSIQAAEMCSTIIKWNRALQFLL